MIAVFLIAVVAGGVDFFSDLATPLLECFQNKEITNNNNTKRTAFSVVGVF